MATAQRIDVHHHLAPPTYKEALIAKDRLAPPLRAWSLAKSIEDLEKGGVATAILSITTPGVEWLEEREAMRRVSRECNDYAAGLVRDHKGKFGMFALLPLPHVDLALREIEYTLDTLKADGIGLFTSYGNKWLGDPFLAPVWEELNRRKAVVYTHPSCPDCCENIQPMFRPSMIEYGTDTTRTIASFLFSGAAARYPDIKLIFSHAGGTMPFLIERFHEQMKAPGMTEAVPAGLTPALQKFFYDTAQASNAATMAALKQVIPAAQVVFGTDYPYRTAEEHARGLAGCGAWSAAEIQAIERANPLKLVPRFA
jgi:6-methylsalicylate decarboxylase